MNELKIENWKLKDMSLSPTLDPSLSVFQFSIFNFQFQHAHL